MSTTYDHLSASDAHLWTRRGTEAETDDWNAGHRAPITRADLASALAGHHADDLDALASDEERAEAITALVAGYRHGG